MRHFPTGVSLPPGVTVIEDDELWQRTRNHRLVAALLRDGELEEEYRALGDMHAAQAVKLIKETWHIPVLRQWKHQETTGKQRRTVLEAIDGQLDELTRPKSPPKELGDDEGDEGDGIEGGDGSEGGTGEE